MSSIKILKTQEEGWLFHYCHFILSCLFPEIINGVYNYNQVFRKKILRQSIGNFDKIYNEVMGNRSIEIPEEEYLNLDCYEVIFDWENRYLTREYIDTFRNFIFSRYNIDPTQQDNNYPEVLLIRRGERVDLIDDIELKSKMKLSMIQTGKERREIDKIDDVESYMSDRFGHKFKSVYLEFMPFSEQVRYFNNAKFIVCSHGAAMINLIFCKEKTTIIEVKGDRTFPIFNQIADILDVNIISQVNVRELIINRIKSITIPN